MPGESHRQARGEALEARSDLFSQGVLMYEMATGKTAFSGEHRRSFFDGILHKTPEAPTRLNGNLPGELEKIIQKLMVKKVGERYQSAAELRAALKGLRAKRSSQSVPAVAVVGHWMRRPAVWLPNRSAGSIGPGGRRSRLQALRASAMGEKRGDSASGGVLDGETQKTQVIPGMEEGDFTDRWTEEGQGLVVTKSTPWGGEIWRVDVGTGKRTLLLRMELSDKAGSNFDLRMLYAEESKTYAYDVRRILSELYVAEGLE